MEFKKWLENSQRAQIISPEEKAKMLASLPQDMQDRWNASSQKMSASPPPPPPMKQQPPPAPEPSKPPANYVGTDQEAISKPNDLINMVVKDIQNGKMSPEEIKNIPLSPQMKRAIMLRLQGRY